MLLLLLLLLLSQQQQSFLLFPLLEELPEPEFLLLIGQDVLGVHADRDAPAVATLLAVRLGVLPQVAAAVWQRTTTIVDSL